MTSDVIRQPEELPEQEESSVFQLARDIPAVLPKGDYAAVLLASFCSNVFALALPIMTLQVYDRILVSGSVSTLSVLTAGVVIAVMAEWVLRVSRSYIMGMAGVQFEINTSEEALRRVLAADLKDSERHEAGEYLEGLSAIGRVRDFYSGHLVTALVDMPFILIYLLLIGYLAGEMVWVPMGLLVMFGLIVWVLGRHMRGLVRAREESDSHRYSQVIEMLSGLHSVKALALEDKMQRLYEKLLVDGSARDYALSMTSGIANMLGGIMSQVMMVAVVVAGAPMVIQGDVSMGSLIACLLLAGRLTQPLMRALSLWAHFQEVRLAREQMSTLYSLQSVDVHEGALREVKVSEAFAPVKGAVKLEDVSFRYQENTRWLLRDIQLEIQSGQMVALMGSDVVARTAMLELLAGLYTPEKGAIHVDGLNVAELPDDLRARHVAYVPSDAVIFRGTILENICQFNPAYEAAARQLAEWMGITEDVSKLPMGFETPLSPSGQGDEISPGLRQRIAIVRALAPHPRLILLDNADHALDRDGYNSLFALLGQLKSVATVVLVSDDQNLLRLADRKLTLHHGAFLGAVPSGKAA
jgi:ATP-binding cassette, subfamily C, bacterial LapB